VRITHLSTYDIVGGAAKAAYRLSIGLRALGHDSRLLVFAKEVADPNVILFEPPFDLPTRLRRGIRRRFLERARGAISTRPEGASYFSDDRSQHGGDVLRQVPPSDVLHLHWIAQLVDYTYFFRSLPSGVPIVWTLHDMNPFTGGCHHAADCINFFEQCGSCPQLTLPSPGDFSNGTWKRKRRSYTHLKPSSFCVVTPSRWLAEEAKRSSLMGNFPISVIPNGLDTRQFQPQDRRAAREQLGVPPNSKVLLFVAHVLADKHKGLPLLVDAITRLRSIPDLYLLGLGEGQLAGQLAVPTLSLGYVKEERLLPLAYSAADILVLPTLQENFPGAALEALACGLPIVAFDVGGVPEIVRDGCTGVLVERANSTALGAAIERLLQDPGLRSQMSANCRRVAVQEYALDVQARRYVELYDTLLGRRSQVGT
jgi:glycosyltransferase involved in cell wall biosynthesis